MQIVRGGSGSERIHALVVVLLTAATFGVLWALGNVAAPGPDLADPAAWSRRTDPELAIIAALRLLGLVVSGWLLTTSVLYALAVRGRHRGLRHVVGSFTLPAVRRLVERAAVVSITASSLLGGATGAWAQAEPSVTSGDVVVEEPVVRDRPAPSTSVPPTSTSTTTPTTTTSTPTPPDVAADPPPPIPEREPRVTPTPVRSEVLHVVEAGESFWLIAQQLVAERRGTTVEDLTPADVHDTWVELVETNRATIRSGNPNLIYPGEVVTLPGAGTN